MPLSGPGILSLGSRKPGLTVFKASGPSAFNAAAFGTLYDGWDVAMQSGADASAISSIPSVIASGRNLVQATGAKQPLLKTGIQNGLKVARLDGVDDGFTATGVSIAQTDYIAAVVIPRKVNGTAQFFIDGATARQAFYIDTDNTWKQYAGAIHATAITAVSGTAALITSQYSGATSFFKVNGTSHSASPSTNALTSLIIGSAQGAGFPSQYDLCCLYIFSALTDQAGLEAALKTRWGTP